MYLKTSIHWFTDVFYNLILWEKGLFWDQRHHMTDPEVVIPHSGHYIKLASSHGAPPGGLVGALNHMISYESCAWFFVRRRKNSVRIRRFSCTSATAWSLTVLYFMNVWVSVNFLQCDSYVHFFLLYCIYYIFHIYDLHSLPRLASPCCEDTPSKS